MKRYSHVGGIFIIAINIHVIYDSIQLILLYNSNPSIMYLYQYPKSALLLSIVLSLLGIIAGVRILLGYNSTMKLTYFIGVFSTLFYYMFPMF